MGIGQSLRQRQRAVVKPWAMEVEGLNLGYIWGHCRNWEIFSWPEMHWNADFNNKFWTFTEAMPYTAIMGRSYSRSPDYFNSQRS